MNNNQVKHNAKNAQGKRLIEKVYLEYSEIITKTLLEHPEIADDLINYLEVSETDFWKYLSGDTRANITFYDAALIISQELTANQKVLKNSSFNEK